MIAHSPHGMLSQWYSWVAHREKEWVVGKAAPPLLHMACHSVMDVITELGVQAIVRTMRQ